MHIIAIIYAQHFTFFDKSSNCILCNSSGCQRLSYGIDFRNLFGVAFAMRPVVYPVLTWFEKRKLMILVFIINGAANICYILFSNIPGFIAFRLIHELQCALVGNLTMTLAGDNLPKEKMASSMEIYGLSSSVSMAIAPTFGLSILKYGTHLKNESFGFTCIFLFGVIISIIVIFKSLYFYRM